MMNSELFAVLPCGSSIKSKLFKAVDFALDANERMGCFEIGLILFMWL